MIMSLFNIFQKLLRAIAEGDEKSIKSLCSTGLVDFEYRYNKHILSRFLDNGIFSFCGDEESDEETDNALEIVVKMKNLEQTKLLLKNGANPDIIFSSICSIDSKGDLVEMMIKECGANVNGIESDWTPLHFAAHQGNVVVVKKLLDAGANLSAKTSDGLTPIALAALNDHHNVVETIQSHIESTNA